ncbi:MAG: 3'(2'),5'-bisphosphate nucleotidase [Oleiphilus sp.]|nr:MAG: 3'(2'),5'-bisphosphate nucleotidase [Oleiphilus sp.]
MSDLESLIAPLKHIIFDAGKAILEVYESSEPLEIDNKEDDSPVTKADLAAHHVIANGLQKLDTKYPVLSEEDGVPDFAERQSWSRYWLVDPLDGTKEFINRNGEFTVNIALIENGTAILGMVYVPVTGTLYYGAEALGSWKEQDGNRQSLQTKTLNYSRTINIVGSRRHGAEALDAMLAEVTPRFTGAELVSMGSSLKICAIAEGKADWYPRLALTSEWDTAAAHAVLSAAGGKIVDTDLKALKYNQKDSLLNPFFHAMGDCAFNWSEIIKPGHH